jgi:hypothetical protein
MNVEKTVGHGVEYPQQKKPVVMDENCQISKVVNETG